MAIEEFRYNDFGEKEPAKVLIADNVLIHLAELNAMLDIPENKLYARGVIFLNWAAENIVEKRSIFIFRPNDNKVLRVESPLTESARTGFVDEDWVRQSEEFIGRMKAINAGVVIDLKEIMSRFLRNIGKQTGVRSPELILNHGGSYFSTVFKEDPIDTVVAAVDLKNPRNREYQLWSMDMEDPIGARKWTIERMIDSFSEEEVEVVEARGPLVSAA